MEGSEAKRPKQLSLSALFGGSKVEVKVPPKRGLGRPKSLPSEDVVVALEAGMTEEERTLGQRFGAGPLQEALDEALRMQGVVVEAEQERAIAEEPRRWTVCRKRGAEGASIRG